MSRYHAQPDSAAEDAGCEALAPGLSPFLPTADQSETWHQALPPLSGLIEGGTTIQLHAQVDVTPFQGARSNRLEPHDPLDRRDPTNRNKDTSREGGGSARHSRVESYPTHRCSTCSASFPNNYQLEQHAAKIKHKAYLCTCGKAFSKLSALRRHAEESTQTRQHRCPHTLCDNEFKRPGHVEQHLRLIHRMSKDAIKDLLSAQKLQPRREPEQANTDSAVVPRSGSLNLHAGYPPVNPGGPWTGPTDFSATAPVGQAGSGPAYYPVFSSGVPAPTTGSVTGNTTFSAQNFMTQAPGLAAYPAYPAGPVAGQAGLPTIPAPDFVGYPAAFPNQNFGLFNVDPALASLNPADGFALPALETELEGGLFDFDPNTFSF